MISAGNKTNVVCPLGWIFQSCLIYLEG